MSSLDVTNANPLILQAYGDPPTGSATLNIQFAGRNIVTEKIPFLVTNTGPQEQVTAREIITAINTQPRLSSGQTAPHPVGLRTCLDSAYILNNQNDRTGRQGIIIGSKRFWSVMNNRWEFHDVCLVPGRRVPENLRLQIAYNPNHGRAVPFLIDPAAVEAQLATTQQSLPDLRLQNKKNSVTLSYRSTISFSRCIITAQPGPDGICLEGPVRTFWYRLHGPLHVRMAAFLDGMRNMILAKDFNNQWERTTNTHFRHSLV